MRVVSGTVSRVEHPVGPLTGTLVLDFGQTAVGPVCAMFLGYLGATVIKVEQPRGELGRFDVSRKHGAGMTFLSTNLGKFGVIFDLKDPLDRAYTLDLLARADVVVDNFRSPEVMQRLGLDFFDVMRPINPGLVYVQSSSFQGLGPLKDFPSFEWAAQALSGFAGATGRIGEKPEFSRGTAYLDWSGAMMNVVAVLAGLHRRRATGEGAMLSTSQFGTSVFVGASRLVTASRDPARLGHDFGGCLLDRAFATSDGFISICVPTEAVWRRLMTAVGATDRQSCRSQRIRAGAGAQVRRDRSVGGAAPSSPGALWRRHCRSHTGRGAQGRATGDGRRPDPRVRRRSGGNPLRRTAMVDRGCERAVAPTGSGAW